MKARRSLLSLLLCFFTSSASSAEGLVSVKSPHGAAATMDRFEALAEQRGLSIFARIDHAAGAAQVGSTLRPTELLIFGNPRGGTPLMQCAQTIGIELPLKALVWEDESAQVWVGYLDPALLAQRHGVASCPAVEGLQKVLSELTSATIAP